MRSTLCIALFLLLSVSPPTPVLSQDLYGRAEESYRAGRIAEAEALYSRVGRSDPHFWEALVRLGTICYATERPALAEDRFSAALRLRESADVLTLLAGAQFNQEKFDAAYKSAKRAVELDPKHAKAYTALGMIYTALKNWPDADAAYGEALRLDPNDSTSWYLQGRSYFARNQFEKAREAFHSALRLDPGSIRVYENLALTLELLGDLKAAEVIFEEGIRENRHRSAPEGHIGIIYGEFLFRQDRLEESRRAFEEALSFSAGDPEAHYELSKTLLALNELKKAAEEGEAALRLGKSDYRVHFLLARIYSALGDEAAASRHAEQAARLGDGAQGPPR